jgi:hypothetical protein
LSKRNKKYSVSRGKSIFAFLRRHAKTLYQWPQLQKEAREGILRRLDRANFFSRMDWDAVSAGSEPNQSLALDATGQDGQRRFLTS